MFGGNHNATTSGFARLILGVSSVQDMDLRTYFQLFWAPDIASAALLALLWTRDGPSGRTRLFFASWFLLAFVAQYAGTTAGVIWAAGLALQTVLAVVLLLKAQTDLF